MTDTETQALMQHHGIAASEQAVYHFRGFKYGRLQDALDYAELVESRETAAHEPETRTDR